MRLQAKLALALVPLILLPVLALGWATWRSLAGDLQHQTAHGLGEALLVADRAVGDLVERAESSIELLASAPETERYARGIDVYDRYHLFQPALLKLFHEYRNAYPDYLEVRFLTPAGEEDARAGGIASARLPAPQDPDAAVLAADARPLLLRLDAASDALLLYRRVALPPQYSESGSGNDRLYGFVALTVSLARAYARIAEPGLASGGMLMLVRSGGDVLFGSGGEVKGELLPEPARVLLKPEIGSAEPATLQWNGQRSLVQVRPIAAGLYAVAVMPLSAVSASLRGLALKILLLTLLFGLLLVAVLHVWLRRLVIGPVATLRQAARAIGDGVLYPEIALHANDELGLLADDLRDMGKRLGQYREQIEQLAFHDQLTGLPNRYLIRELLTEQIGESGPRAEPVAVLFLDIDNFKQINDNLGHAVGDMLLATFASRLSAELAADELGFRAHLARFGGDELLVVATSTGGADGVDSLANRILAIAAEPFDLGGINYVVTVSIGIALYPSDAEDADGLIRCADLAMYRAKAVGRNTYRFFSAELNARASERLLIEHRLRHAVQEKNLAVYYQPIVSLESGRLNGFEALLRWTDPELGTVSPVRFIPIAEETGLIDDLGRWVLNAVCAQLSAWRAKGLELVPVAVNVSAAHLQREPMADLVADSLQRYGLTPANLHMEITESVLMDLTPTNTKRLQALAKLGIALHIDDFGTGYSSINYLRRFPIDCIKIDRSFVVNICTRDEDRALATAMVAMAKALNLRVIAEGIEDLEQLALLRELGCNLGQGYLFARAGDSAAAERCLSGSRVLSQGTAATALGLARA